MLIIHYYVQNTYTVQCIIHNNILSTKGTHAWQLISMLLIAIICERRLAPWMSLTSS